MTVLSRILGNFKTKPKTPEEQLADLAQLPMSSPVSYTHLTLPTSDLV